MERNPHYIRVEARGDKMEYINLLNNSILNTLTYLEEVLKDYLVSNAKKNKIVLFHKQKNKIFSQFTIYYEGSPAEIMSAIRANLYKMY